MGKDKAYLVEFSFKNDVTGNRVNDSMVVHCFREGREEWAKKQVVNTLRGRGARGVSILSVTMKQLEQNDHT